MRTARQASGHSIRRAQAPKSDETGLDRSSLWEAAAWQVREDRAFYVPDVMSDRSYEADAELHRAANEHARDLRRAQRRLEDMLSLAGVLRASIGDEGDSRAMQAETVLKIIERKADKALDQLDRHDGQHRNLFFAYFDLLDTAEEGGDGE
ncbi:MAG TPA: hypothetical protein VF226_03785 [Hyphomicrobiaceae bacterium]